jgi:hypothetical protein
MAVAAFGAVCQCSSTDGGRWRARLARACAEHVRLGPATLLLYDVTTLYFETDTGDGFREPAFSTLYTPSDHDR